MGSNATRHDTEEEVAGVAGKVTMPIAFVDQIGKRLEIISRMGVGVAQAQHIGMIAALLKQAVDGATESPTQQTSAVETQAEGD